MSYPKKLVSFLLIDMGLVVASVYSSYFLRFNSFTPDDYLQQCILYAVISVAATAGCMLAFRLYQRIWQYASVTEVVAIVKAIALSCALSYALTALLSGKTVPLTVFVRTFETMLLLIGGARFVLRLIPSGQAKRQHMQNASAQQNAIIVGAGDCGTLVAKKLIGNKDALMTPVAFIDDDKSKHHQVVCGLPVWGGKEAIGSAVRQFEASHIIIAMPSGSRKQISETIAICKQTPCMLKIIPKIDDLIHGKLSVSQIRNVDVEDLLGRDPVTLDTAGIAGYISGKTVLVTGAGGSIGSELCRQIARIGPKLLLLLGKGENSIYAIEMELRQLYPALALETVIADIRDAARVDDVFRRFSPQVVFHAAAHKHVPLMERNPAEAIKNNVFGTKHVADCADRYGTERFVMISTDKAVNPSSVMGATKRIAEMYIQNLNGTSATRFATVRFGNVLGSRGSVIPRFKQQIAAGGPVTVTHPDMIRYFMTIPEAVQLVIQAGAFAEGGEIFVLDMGKPVRIVDLASDLIRLSGFEAGKDIDIVYTGIRPGEKLYEELLLDDEELTATKHQRIFVGRLSGVSRPALELALKRLEKAALEDDASIRASLRLVVPTYEAPAERATVEMAAGAEPTGDNARNGNAGGTSK
ncbi:MAG: polysaccharide biosynthesis protein [Paenibacillaceae bacterium]|nr:polysaccharide biosynthesis protein [Paenibacillaceae bacterium]